MNDSRTHRVRFEALVAQAALAADAGNFEEVVVQLVAAASYAQSNYTGVFLDRRVEALLDRVARHVNASFSTVPRCDKSVGLLMTSIHPYGGHSKIAWRWVQVDRDHHFRLVLTAQQNRQEPEQLLELLEMGRMDCIRLPASGGLLQRIADARDEIAGADFLIMNIHPDDVIGAVAAACLRERLRTVFVDHAYFSFSLGMTHAHALCCTTPAAVAIATQERLISPEHLVWYRNAPEWLGRNIEVDEHDVREQLGVPEGALLLLSSGSEHKFYPVRGVGLLDLVAPVLDAFPEAHLAIVGIYHPERFVGPLLARHASRVHLLAPVGERVLLRYITVCDIYLDSVPNHSGGAAQQAMLLSKPTLAYADPLTYRAHLAPQFFTVDDFSWIHFSVGSYRTDLQELTRNPAWRQQRGEFLKAQVSSRISEQDNLESIRASYRKARLAPLIGQTLQDESLRMDNPALHEVFDKNLAGWAAFSNPANHAAPAARGAGGVAGVRALAFYLPQFHEIPENNAWWGEGFTEWTNVRQAKPLFEGHEQPLVPGELGYYDLSSVDVLERQAKLAKEHGIHGFCFHYYWFDGKRLLEKPVDQLLRAPQIDLPFCLCWANENWTRRWDGGEQEVLMPQSYSPELHERFARDLLPYFSDRRYIRVQGNPVLLIYRTDIIPDLKNTVASWRDAWRALGLGEVYLVAVESFRAVDPHEWGFDACCDFPPHQVDFRAIAPQRPVNLVADTQARVGDYGRLRDSWLGRPPPGYKRFCGLVPGWDNSARRRKGGATLFVDATPERYRTWLREAVARTVNEFEGDERLVFINAWNEWAEGCVLEPTQRWGRAYLEATRDVLRLPQQEFLRPVSSPYQQWLDGRLDCIKEISLYLAAGVHIQVLIAGGDAVAITRTRAALDAQQRAPDRVLTLAEDGLTALGEEGWTLLLHAGDTLETDALARLHLLLSEPEAEGARVVYFDHDELDAQGRLATPYFKPDFNHDLLLSYPYVGRALAVRNDWALPLLAGQGDGPFDLALAYRLALSAAAEGGARALRHIAAPLLHLTSEQPTVFCTTSEAWQALAGVLAEHLARAEPGSEVTEGPAPGTFHVIPPLPRTPLVSIVIPTRDQLPFLSRCIESLLEKTNYPNFEVLVVDNGSQTPEAREFLAGLAQVDPARIRVLAAPGAFNFSRMNNLAVKQARGEYLLLLNNDTAALQPDWLTMMVRHALRPGVGIVGARLLYPDGSLQHAGIIMGLRGPAEHPALGAPADQVGYLFRTQVQQDFSAVTAACLLVGKAVYEEVGGLDEQAFAVSYNDVDFCLRVGATGRRIVWTPLATLLHEGSASQKRSIENLGQVGKQARFTREQGAMYERWPDVIAHDPAYNPNLSLTERVYEIEFNALLRPAPPRVAGRPHALVFPGDTQGCGHYRLIQPLDAMVQARLATGRVSLSSMRAHLALASGADVLVFQRCFTDAGLQALQELRSLKQVRKVYDADDLDSRIRITNASYRQTLKDARGRMAKAIGLCDRLVVSTQPLAQALSGTSDDIRVVANRLAPGMWGVEPPKRDIGRPRRKGKPRVGWAGSTSHYGDLKMIADVIRDLAGEVDWVFMGMCPEEIRPYVKEFYAGVPTLEWPRHLMAQDWDLAIAPLESHAFNECKSNLKLLEYGWCAMPVVCSDVAPYQGDLPVVRVKNRHKDWCDAIRATLADGTQARAQGLALQRKVQSDWVLEGEHVSEWLAAWAS